MHVVDRLCPDLWRHIYQFLCQDDILRLPFCNHIYIRELQFPRVFPIRPKDASSFLTWIRRRYSCLEHHVETVCFYWCRFSVSGRDVLMQALRAVLMLPNIRHLTVRSFPLPHESSLSSSHTWLTVLLTLRSLRSLKTIDAGAIPLLHLPCACHYDTIHISYSRTYVVHSTTEGTYQYTYDTFLHPLMVFLDRLSANGGSIQRLRIAMLDVSDSSIASIFSFLWDRPYSLASVVKTIHFDSFLVRKHLVMDEWRYQDVGCTRRR